jgi:hypothetical protein
VVGSSDVVGRLLAEGGARTPLAPVLPEQACRREPRRKGPGETRRPSVERVVDSSAPPKPLASLLPERGWQHRRVGRHVGDRSCPFCSRRAGASRAHAGA